MIEVVRVKKMHDNAIVGSSGADLHAVEYDMIEPGKWKAIPTGLAFQVDHGIEIQIRPRSGLALRAGVTVLNSPGTIDSDYRGQVKVILINHSSWTFQISSGDRIAQMIVARVEQPAFYVIDELNDTDRGANGFGSTGVETKTK
jgi:dUTP pyrophosphatase